jgi:hypothetical protein
MKTDESDDPAPMRRRTQLTPGEVEMTIVSWTADGSTLGSPLDPCRTSSPRIVSTVGVHRHRVGRVEGKECLAESRSWRWMSKTVLDSWSSETSLRISSREWYCCCWRPSRLVWEGLRVLQYEGTPN